MKIWDAQEQLVWDSVVSVAVLGKGREFMLIPLPTGTAGSAKLEEAKRRGFIYCGVLGIRDGQPSAECVSPDAAITMVHAVLAFLQAEAGRLRSKDDSVQWLTRLWELPDPRE